MDIKAECETCGKKWYSRNAHGVAANHAKKTGHKVWVEKTYGWYYNKDQPSTEEGIKDK